MRHLISRLKTINHFKTCIFKSGYKIANVKNASIFYSFFQTSKACDELSYSLAYIFSKYLPVNLYLILFLVTLPSALINGITIVWVFLS